MGYFYTKGASFQVRERERSLGMGIVGHQLVSMTIEKSGSESIVNDTLCI